MNVKIESCTRELKQIRGDLTGTLYTGIKVNGNWFNIEGDHRNLYNKVVDLEFNGPIAKFTQPQTPPAPAQRPPTLPPPTNGHTPKWASRDDAVDAYVWYLTQLSGYITDPYALIRATNCIMMTEKDGEINPVHRKEPGSDG